MPSPTSATLAQQSNEDAGEKTQEARGYRQDVLHARQAKNFETMFQAVVSYSGLTGQQGMAADVGCSL